MNRYIEEMDQMLRDKIETTEFSDGVLPQFGNSSNINLFQQQQLDRERITQDLFRFE
jgi:hypothetical protein